MRTIEAIDTECAQTVLALGQRRYHAFLIDKEIAGLCQKVLDLNEEAMRVREAIEAAKAVLAAEAPAEAPAETSETEPAAEASDV